MLEQDYSHTNQRRQLENEDLEQALDRNQQIEDKDLQSKILFAIQGLGSIRSIDQDGKLIEAYIKGQHCEESIKDLVKFLRNDAPDNPKTKMILADYNIVQTDLVELLLLQVEDKKLSFWIIALLALITNKPSDELIDDDKQKLYKAARDYKRSFVKHECLTILTMHIADYFKTQTKQKAHYQMLEFIIVLIRNLLQIPESPADNEALHNHFLTTIIREEMFNPLLYLVQNEKSEVMERIDIALMEIFYYSFTCFDPEVLYKRVDKNKSFQKMALQSKLSRGPPPVRHSRFLPNFMQKSDVGVNRIVHKLNDTAEPIRNQRQVPRRTADLKKVERIDQEYYSQNFMELQFQVNDPQLGRPVTKKIKEMVFELCQEFVQVELALVSNLVFSQIYKETSKVTTQNVIQYLLMCNWAIKMTRAKFLYQKSQEKNEVQASQVQFDLAQILHVMQNAHFELIYKILFRQATREKKKQFKVNTFNAGLKLFEGYLNVIQDISHSFRPADRSNANVLMANVFRHDIARIFKIGFLQISHQGILKTLISVCHKFYKLLSRYSNGKVLTIQTNKLLKRKNKSKVRNQEEELVDFISEDEEDEDGENSYQEGEDMRERKEKKPKKAQRQQVQQSQTPLFQQRKFNEISQFAIIAEYDIISKYLIFLKDGRVMRNSDEFNESIFFYFEQISKLLKGDWLFFQAETLVVFQEVLSFAPELIKRNKTLWVDRVKFVRNVCKDFIKLLQRNKLALVESLFHYPNLSLKEKILKNYEDGDYVAGDDIEQNMFADRDEDE